MHQLDEAHAEEAPVAAIRAAFLSARRRAAGSGLDFRLSYDDVLRLYEQQDRRCAISRLQFTMKRFAAAFVKHPFAPSLDRIDCAQGYTVANVRLVCVAVNFGLGQWGEEVFRTIAEATVNNQPRPTAMRERELNERIAAAEAVLPLLTDDERRRQRHHIAGLKAARTKGPEIRRLAGLKAVRTKGPNGLKTAAERAKRTRRSRLHGS
jgi:hypothetical protein